jgi:hypothetical protein
MGANAESDLRAPLGDAGAVTWATRTIAEYPRLDQRPGMAPLEWCRQFTAGGVLTRLESLFAQLASVRD